MTTKITDLHSMNEDIRIRFKIRFLGLWTVLLAACLLVILWTGLHYWQPQITKDILDFSDDWNLVHSETGHTTPIGHLRSYVFAEPGETITLKKTLPQSIAADASLLIQSYNQEVKIAAGDAVLYQNRLDDTTKKQSMEIILLPLPEEAAGAEVTVQIRSPYRVYSYSIEPVYLGSTGALEAYIWSSSMPSVIMAVMVAISGLLSFVFAFYTSVRKKVAVRDNLTFGCFAVLLAPFLLSDSLAFYHVFPPAKAAFLWNLFWYAFQIPLALIAGNHLTKCKKTGYILTFAYSLLLSSLVLLDVTDTVPFASSLEIGNLSASVFAVILSVIFCIELYFGNRFIRFFLFPVGMLLVVAALYHFDSSGQFFQLKQFLLHCTFLVIIVLLWLYQIGRYVKERQRQTGLQQLLAMKNRELMEQIHQTAAVEHETRKIQHDINHHLSAVKILLEEKDLQGMRHYLDRLIPDLTIHDDTRYTQNPLINMILKEGARQARQTGIDFQVTAAIPAQPGLPEPEIVTLLMNLLENAIEAAQKSKPSWLHIQLTQKEDFIVICCRNSYLPAGLVWRDGQLHSSKTDQKNHGFGLLAMKQAAKKMNGILHIRYDEHEFETKAVLRTGNPENHP